MSIPSAPHPPRTSRFLPFISLHVLHGKFTRSLASALTHFSSSSLQCGEEIHLQRLGEALRRAERDVDIAGEELGHIWSGYIHALGKLSLRKPEPLHLDDAAAQERAYKVVCRLHAAYCNIFIT